MALGFSKCGRSEFCWAQWRPSSFVKNGITVDLKSYSKYHIDVWVSEEDGRMWRFTGFYGEPARARRRESWRLMRFLRNQANLPWLCVGDFN